MYRSSCRTCTPDSRRPARAPPAPPEMVPRAPTRERCQKFRDVAPCFALAALNRCRDEGAVNGQGARMGVAHELRNTLQPDPGRRCARLPIPARPERDSDRTLRCVSDRLHRHGDERRSGKARDGDASGFEPRLRGSLRRLREGWLVAAGPIQRMGGHGRRSPNRQQHCQCSAPSTCRHWRQPPARTQLPGNAAQRSNAVGPDLRNQRQHLGAEGRCTGRIGRRSARARLI